MSPPGFIDFRLRTCVKARSLLCRGIVVATAPLWLGKAAEREEMRRIVEPPMHVDSELSSNIQCADWICALAKRAIDYQLVEDTRYRWVVESTELSAARGAFTYESKLHLYQRDIEHLHHSAIMNSNRPVIAYEHLKSENKERLEAVRRSSSI
ncbi:hypothetical protein C3B44_05870 [Corynebacterium yudongzhengii]|uniref:DUF3800 domain-containing protein n=1 Tax=Corynebacterium yudongzhengii TaxID=2080740 RepID=A0A2U1T8J5_9CORY|nr:hypothetical protein C3B44_05870 [Corynebacterium yudongzhengii]PWC02330.1 DUF3800 domain-containing protein [Corynebacterium yudongzhengii]